MLLTAKGEEIMAAMQKQYGEAKGTEVFYKSKNAGTITGVDAVSKLDACVAMADSIKARCDARISGYVVENMGMYKIIEGIGPDAGYWFAVGRGETKRCNSRAQAVEHAQLSSH